MYPYCVGKANWIVRYIGWIYQRLSPASDGAESYEAEEMCSLRRCGYREILPRQRPSKSLFLCTGKTIPVFR